MKLYIKICIISSAIMLCVIGTYSFLFSQTREQSQRVNASEDEIDIKTVIESERRRFIALTCDAVCPSAPYLCKVAFCSVILNRCSDPSFPDTPAEIVCADPILSDAFAIDFEKKPSKLSLMAYDDALSGFSPCPEALYYSTSEITDIGFKKRQTLFRIGKYIFS